MDTQSERGVEIRLPFPTGGEQVFRYRAAGDILRLLTRNPLRAFGVRQLRELTDNGSKTTTRALDLLQRLDLVRVDASGRRKLVSLNRQRVILPDEPLFAIPQDEFREPVRAFVERAREEVPGFSALLVFGSVARGEADRKSDIDIWVLVDDEEVLAARRTATALAAELGETRFDGQQAPRSRGNSPVRDPGDRYEFEVLVESVDTATDHDEQLREVLTEGVVIVDSEPLRRVKDAVLDGEVVAE